MDKGPTLDAPNSVCRCRGEKSDCEKFTRINLDEFGAFVVDIFFEIDLDISHIVRKGIWSQKIESGG